MKARYLPAGRSSSFVQSFYIFVKRRYRNSGWKLEALVFSLNHHPGHRTVICVPNREGILKIKLAGSTEVVDTDCVRKGSIVSSPKLASVIPYQTWCFLRGRNQIGHSSVPKCSWRGMRSTDRCSRNLPACRSPSILNSHGH